VKAFGNLASLALAVCTATGFSGGASLPVPKSFSEGATGLLRTSACRLLAEEPGAVAAYY
jgi:hypothetical protein